MRDLTWKILLLAIATCLMAARVEAKPNFSGNWKLNLDKSDFGPLPPPSARSNQIEHSEPNLKITTTQSGAQGEFTYAMSYTTGGKESSNDVAGNTFKSTANWDGDVLVVDTKGSFNGNDFTTQEKYSLSPDGKVITVNRHLKSAMGEADQKTIMEKE